MESSQDQSFNVVTTTKSSKSSKKTLIIGVAIIIFLVISIPVGVYLVKQQQNIREKAAEALACPAAEACPVAGQPTLLKSCYAAVSGEAPRDISCSTVANVGSIATCGSSSYCCPSLSAGWTTDLSLCSTPSPTPTLTPTLTPSPSASGSATATASATPTATATSSATPVPIPVTGTSWPTILGAGVGVIVIVGSILLAI